MKTIEKIIAIIAIITLGLKLLFIPGSGILTVLTFSTLSLIYFYFGFALFNDIRLRNIFKKASYKDISALRIVGSIGAGIALSTTIIGIMFKFQSWPGASVNLGVGLLGLLIIVIISCIKYSKNKSNYYVNIFKRAAIFGGIGIVLMSLPQTTWIAIKYRNQPAFVEAYKKAMVDPDNKALWENVEIERRKMNAQIEKDRR